MMQAMMNTPIILRASVTAAFGKTSLPSTIDTANNPRARKSRMNQFRSIMPYCLASVKPTLLLVQPKPNPQRSPTQSKNKQTQKRLGLPKNPRKNTKLRRSQGHKRSCCETELQLSHQHPEQKPKHNPKNKQKRLNPNPKKFFHTHTQASVLIWVSST